MLSFFLAMQLRNKQVTKHFTEKTIKEVWNEKLLERKAGRESDMCDFVCNFFQKRIGIMSAVVEASLYFQALCKARYDLVLSLARYMGEA